MNETFYTYLHGPRTFWGNSSSNIRINNNFGFPAMPPMMSNGCCCGGGKANNSLSIMMMLNSMMQQTLPLWNFTKSEGAGSASTQTSLTTDRFTSTRQSMDQLGYTQAAGYGLYLDENGNVVYHYNKDGKDITATSMSELTTKIASEKSEGAGGSGVATSFGNSIVAPTTTATSDSSVDSTTATDEVNGSDEADEVVGTEFSNTITGNSTAKSKRKFSRGDVGKGFEWTTMSNLNDKELKAKINDKGCKTVIGLMKILFPSFFDGKSDAEIKGSKYYKLLMNANPSAIDDNGNIVNKNKLDIVVLKGKANQAASTRNSAHKISLKNGYALERKADGSYSYTKNGKPVDPATFAKACPQTFINEHNKRWTFETIQAALKVYDSTRLANYSASGQNHFGNIGGFTQGNMVSLNAHYKGNGVTNNWFYTMTYKNVKDGIIGLDIAKIYADLDQGYNKCGD